MQVPLTRNRGVGLWRDLFHGSLPIDQQSYPSRFNMTTAVNSILNYFLHLASLNLLNLYGKNTGIKWNGLFWQPEDHKMPKRTTSRGLCSPNIEWSKGMMINSHNIPNISPNKGNDDIKQTLHTQLVMKAFKVHAVPFDLLFLPQPIIVCWCYCPTSFPLSSWGWICVRLDLCRPPDV